ncbi:DinB family protein [Amycolatopsis benzoatilytica]|uniref:DinB family protein n=1 Tax=Amycolatopsis benzoatilytica TaxID=346045 RepID=UPI00048228BD|nr:DinB family protein [Amycolatopsis benzoatilytica]
MTEAPERPDPPMAGDERTQLTGFLDFLRASVVWKCSGLSDEQARRELVPSKLTTVAGLLCHLTLVENYWFRVVLDGQPDEWAERLEIDRDAEFRAALEIPMAQLIADYQAETERCREVVAARGFDDTVLFKGDRELTVRWVVAHMIEETARHLGHLDLLREMTDGLTGE